MKGLFIIETTEVGYPIVWRGEPENALQALADYKTSNRLELWSKSHASGPKGFAPLAYRAANKTTISVSHTFQLFYGIPSNFVIKS